MMCNPFRIKRFAMIFCLLLGLCPLVASAANFTQVMTTGATAWGDWNNDGWSDMFSGGTVWTNNQAGGFSQSGQPATGYISLGDYNNDGWLDVMGYLPGEQGNQVTLATNNSGTSWINNTSKFLPASEYPYIGRAATWGDFTGDGYLDAYLGGWATTGTWPSGPTKDVIYTSSAGNTFSQTWASSDARNGRGVTTVDYNRDGKLDIYVSNYWMTANYLWKNTGFNGTSGLTAVGGTVADGGHGVGSAIGDFNNDGDFDIYISNFTHDGNPVSRFVENQGSPGYSFTDKGGRGITHFSGQDTPFGSAGAADFNNDGYLDLFLASMGGYATSGQTRLYLSNGNSGDGFPTFSQVDYGLENIGSGDTAAWGDYDNDGFLDLIAADKLWKNPGAANWPSNHYLKVKLVGGDGENGLVNGSAIGAQVFIDVPGLGKISRQVEGNTGQGNQNDLTLHFGLGTNTDPVDLEIFWPDGTVQTRVGVAIDQLTTIGLDMLKFELVPVADPGGNLPLHHRSFDIMATTKNDLGKMEIILDAAAPGSIYQNSFNPAVPADEFDTHVTMPVNFHLTGQAVDIDPNATMAWFDQNLNVAWEPDAGQLTGPGTHKIGRVTMATWASASYTLLGWQTGDDPGPHTSVGTIEPDPQNVSMYMEEIADQTGVPDGYTTYDFFAATDTNLAAFEMILEADTPGSIYQHEFGSAYTEPMPAMVAIYPELEFDTYVTLGAWDYPSPTNVISGAQEIELGSVLTFDEQTLNILWALSDGSYESGPGVFRIARVTLANDAAATWRLMGWQTGDEWVSVYEEGVINVVEVKNRGDVTGDGFVGADDLVQILSHWGESGPAVTWADGDCAPYPGGDDFVGADDYVEVLSMWGTSYPAEPTPEPATLGLLLLGGLLAFKRRR